MGQSDTSHGRVSCSRCAEVSSTARRRGAGPRAMVTRSSATRDRRAALPVVAVPRLDLKAPVVGAAVAAAGLLADPIRASILRLLADGPTCVCEMAAALDARENNISNHLARLREAGLVR